MNPEEQLAADDADIVCLATCLRDCPLEMVEVRPYPAYTNDQSTLCGRLQILVSGPRGKLSVIKGAASYHAFEVWSIGGSLIEDIRRYENVEHAWLAIHYLLTVGTFEEAD